jgi:hypothetical protein
MKRWDPKMGIVCVFSHNTSLGDPRQKLIGALNSPWIRGEAKPKVFGPYWAVSGLFVAFWALSGRFIPFRTISGLSRPVRAVSSPLEAFRASYPSCRNNLGRFRPFWTFSSCFELFRAISGHFGVLQVVCSHFCVF